MLAARSLSRVQLIKNAVRPMSGAAAATSAREYTYFDNLEVRDGVAIVRLNGPEKMNTISTGLQQESEKIFREKILPKKQSGEVKAVVFISSKPDNFIAGADIRMIDEIEDKSTLKDLTLKGHAFFNELKKSGLPMVAAINGATMGGGLEWAMYCDYRIATTNKKTVLALPEVKLGLLPGMGGTYHMPKLIGLQNTLGYILTGKNIRADKAKKMGLVDLVVDPVVLEDVAVSQAKALSDGSLKVKGRKASLVDKIVESPLVRGFVFNKAREQVMKSTGGVYPAPLAILDVMEKGMASGSKEKHLEEEATQFARLAATKESEALIGIFKGMTAVKKHDFPAPTTPVKTVAVLGAGLMGSGIAQVSLNGKYNVLLKDKDEAGAARGEKTVTDAFKEKLKKKRMTNYEFCEATSRLVPLHDDMNSWKTHFSKADLVVEAVFEELSVKHKVLAEMEAVLPEHAIFASNTSAIPIAKIAEGAKRPERVIGMHYFSPVDKMPLLEIITHAGTAPEVAAAAMEVGARQGKTPILVKDVPGFFVNRCLAPFMSEVTALVMEGVDLKMLDKAMKDFGMPVGPITLADEVGIDISNHVGKFMSAADLGDRMKGGDPTLMEQMVANGWLGKKTSRGFYDYTKGNKKGPREYNSDMINLLNKTLEANGVDRAAGAKISVEDIQYRLISKFVNEAAYCLQDEIIRSPVDGDIGAVFGIGFPPFRGGPFRMLDQDGTQQFVDRMLRYRDAHGPQFEPAQILKDYAANGKKFHPK